MVGPQLLVNGMMGLGDGVYQRAIIRQLLPHYTVFLKTPWPAIYHDMPAVTLVDPQQTGLRTQLKNAQREQAKYRPLPPGVTQSMRIWYTRTGIQKYGSLPAAQVGHASETFPICRVGGADFRLPVPAQWQERARAIVGQTTKPLLVYRPLTVRTEWGSAGQRNPDADAYAQLLAAIRDRYFVVSVADLEDGKEWLVGPSVQADLELHGGQLDVEALVGLFSIAGLVFAAPGFAIAMAQAVGVPSVIVFGGHESSASYCRATTLAPALLIDPIRPCDCFHAGHACDKRIDVPVARQRLIEFVDRIAPR